jgi:3-deoxy-manno-octulosonate cytidylyltransferase (CMP-KDO synthetase)
MKVLGLIPSRYASSRFPGKPLIDLAGKSMIQRVYEGAKACQLLDKVIVATDDQRIFDHVEGFGGHALMTSILHESGTDRCGEVLNQFPEYDIIVNIQGDEPLIDPRQLEKLVSAFRDEQVEIATLAIDVHDSNEIFNPNRIKVVVDAQSNAIYFSRHGIPFGANKPQESWLERYPYLRHIGLYAFKTTTLQQLVALAPCNLEKQESLEQLRWMYYGYKIRVVTTDIETPNIDTPEDVQVVLAFLNTTNPA